MPLRESLSVYWQRLQGELFPSLAAELGPLNEKHRHLVTVLDLVRPEAFLDHAHGVVGRPKKDRAALARCFLAKAVFNISETEVLVERLKLDKTLRRLCGWHRGGALPSTATFSRAFAEFAASRLPARLHQALIEATQGERLVGHIARDSTAIEAREQTVRGKPAPPRPKRKRGRPKKGEARPTPPLRERRRLERQGEMSLAEMLADLPRACTPGVKQNAKGYRTHWIGYKLHLDVADGDIPVSAILTSASLHDSQVAIPLATMTAARLTSLYDLMDNAYDAPEIKAHSQPRPGPCPDHRAPSPHGPWQGGAEGRGQGRQSHRPAPRRAYPLPAARRRRTRQRQSQGQFRRPHDPPARPRQGGLPPHVLDHRNSRHSDPAPGAIGAKQPGQGLNRAPVREHHATTNPPRQNSDNIR